MGLLKFSNTSAKFKRLVRSMRKRIGIVESLDCTPVEAMERTIGAERYDCVTVG